MTLDGGPRLTARDMTCTLDSGQTPKTHLCAVLNSGPEARGRHGIRLTWR